MQLKPLVLLAAATAAANAAALPEEIVQPIGAGFFPTDTAAAFEALDRPAVEHIQVSAAELQALFNSTGQVEAAPSDFAVSSRAVAEGPLEERDIINGESRVLKTDTGYPWQAMGRVQRFVSGGESWCSGVAVGSRLIATAKHCVENVQGFNWQPAYYNGARFGSWRVNTVYTLTPGPDPGCRSKEDFAILVLDQNPGFGYLGVKSIRQDQSDQAFDWWNYGYPQDKSGSGQLPYAQNRFRVILDGCNLRSDADSFGGQSGGPVWIPESDGRYLYGLLVGSTPSWTYNAFGDALLNLVVQLRNQHP